MPSERSERQGISRVLVMPSERSERQGISRILVMPSERSERQGISRILVMPASVASVRASPAPVIWHARRHRLLIICK